MKVRNAKTIKEAVEELERKFGKMEFVNYNPYDGSHIYINDRLGFVAIRKVTRGIEVDVLGY